MPRRGRSTCLPGIRRRSARCRRSVLPGARTAGRRAALSPPSQLPPFRLPESLAKSVRWSPALLAVSWSRRELRSRLLSSYEAQKIPQRVLGGHGLRRHGSQVATNRWTWEAWYAGLEPATGAGRSAALVLPMSFGNECPEGFRSWCALAGAVIRQPAHGGGWADGLIWVAAHSVLGMRSRGARGGLAVGDLRRGSGLWRLAQADVVGSAWLAAPRVPGLGCLFDDTGAELVGLVCPAGRGLMAISCGGVARLV